MTYKWEHTQPYYIKVWATGLLGSSEKEVSIDIANGKFEYITENCGNVRDCKTVVEFTGEDIYFSALSWDITIKISSNGELEVVSNLKNITTMLVEIVYDYDDL